MGSLRALPHTAIVTNGACAAIFQAVPGIHSAGRFAPCDMA